MIEALDPMGTPEDAVNDLMSRPDFDHEYIHHLPTSMRLLDMTAFDELYYPPEIAGSFAESVDMLIRAAYARRNPLEPAVMADLYNKRELMKAQGVHGATLAGMILLVGNSGMGKTRLVRAVLGRMPQGIVHTKYAGTSFNATQVTWLSVDAPIRGSQKGLMLRMLSALDEAAGLSGTPAAYGPLHHKDSVDSLIGTFGTAAANHHLGVLHVDDLQRISSLRSEKYTALQFIIQLANAVKCPVIFSGTPDIEQDYAKEFEAIRRMCSGGYFQLKRSKEFGQRLLKAAFKFQWTNTPVQPTDEQIARLRTYTQDITSVTLLMYKEAQRLALQNGDAQLSSEHFRRVYHTTLRPMHAALRALRRGGAEAEASYENLFPQNASRSGDPT
ncbi:ATP-binding protein [Ramlibacter sp. AN1015]|uniref:ATP-binding protein n=1 Tax=Ramlibacter sp. AN1015 TaxID=3133428 RepID=UPI0030BBA61C